jgi:hypothetical protein
LNERRPTVPTPSTPWPEGSGLPKPDYATFSELKELAGKAEYLRRSQRVTTWQAAVVSSVLTIILAFAISFATGIRSDETASQRAVKESRDILVDHRVSSCYAYNKLIRLVVKQPGLPRKATILNCRAIPENRYVIFKEGGE